MNLDALQIGRIVSGNLEFTFKEWTFGTWVWVRHWKKEMTSRLKVSTKSNRKKKEVDVLKS